MHLEPIVSFAILLAVILIVPLCFERLRIPGLLGLLIAGVALGPYGLNLLNTESETMSLLSDIGLVYLMFVAGLEIELHQFQATKHRSAGFGFFTFIFPLIAGTAVGRLFGFDWNASVLIGSLLASHTLLAYPILSRLGVMSNEAVVVTIGATIFTDIGSLAVLAICVGISRGDFSILDLAQLLISLVVYSSLILFGFSWLGREFFRRSGDEQGNQFLFILLVVFLASLGAELIGVEKIIGAFLAGLAVNSVVGDGPVKEKVLFVGSVLFIPIFFVDMGLLINIPDFVASVGSLLAISIVVALISSKFLAALLSKLAYRYSWRETITMWSLSLPQVAATLAATFVGYRAQIISEDVLNSVVVLFIVTSTLGPLITDRAARRLNLEAENRQPTGGFSLTDSLLEDWSDESQQRLLTIMVPVYNPETERYLLEMAALIARHESGKVIPLSIAMGHIHMDAPELRGAIQRSEERVAQALAFSQDLDVEVTPLMRIDDSIAQGISRASREQQASLVIMGWGKTTGLRARLFGNVIDNVVWASHCPVAVTRLLSSPFSIQRILVPVKSPSQRAMRLIHFAEILAEANQAEVTLMHVCDRYTSPEQIDWIKTQLEAAVAKNSSSVKPQIRVVTADRIADAIIASSPSFDLVVMRARRRRVHLDLAIDDVTAEVVRRVKCSIVMMGEPHRYRGA
ncbi:MAG: cation:proton antiporter [Elainellaceae cyanobacterium]